MDYNSDMSSLADKLKALGVSVGTSELKPPEPKRGVRIQEVMDGSLIETRLGQTFVAEQHHPLEYRHGVVPIQLESPLEVVAAWARDDRLRELPPESFVFLDTETSGLSGGTGTYAFMVGAGRFEATDQGVTFRLAQFFMRDPDEEPAMLEALAEFLAPAQALVTYNGKAFDLPLLRTRYLLQSQPVPFEGYAHVDLLPLARRLWRERLPSRTLKYIEENVLVAPRSSEEVPGYEIPYLYFDYLRSGDATPLKGVFYHNAMDILSLAALLNHTAGLLADPLNGQIEHGLDLVAIARLYEDLGRWDEATRIYERGLETELEESDFWGALRRLSILQKRRGDLEAAVSWWEQAAAEGHIYAHVELAKYYEHRLKDYAEALHWTQAALEHVAQAAFPEYIRKYWMGELEHRLQRLERKSAK
jgi:uncharacterized protein YprB with RNaseH-like and TPR domain